MSYRGFTVPFPVGQQGFTGTENPSEAGPGHLLYVDGAELDGGIIRKEGGATKLNGTAIDGGAAIISGINWSPVSATNRDVIFTSTGKILKDTSGGSFSVTMASGLTPVRDPPPLFVAGGGETVGQPRKLFCFSATNQVRIALGDAGTMAAISGPVSDWTTAFPTFGVFHEKRMWAGGNGSDPHRLYYSAIDNHQNFTDTAAGAGDLAIYPGEGECLAGGVSFKGALVVFKYPVGIYIVDTRDTNKANWRVTRLTKAVGTLNQQTIINIENDVVYADVIGSPHALSTTQEFGDYTSSDIGEADDIGAFLRKAVSPSRLRRSQGIWYPRRQQVQIVLPLLGSDEPNLRFVTLFDVTQGSQGVPSRRFFMSRRDVASSIWLRPDSAGVPRPAIGDNAGFIWDLDQDSRSKDSAGYTFAFETANTDFAFFDPQVATRSKAGQFLELSYEPKGNWDLTVEVFWDDIPTDVILFRMGQTGAPLGSFVLDADVLTSSVIRSQRHRMAGSGRRLRLVGDNAGANQDVSVTAFHVGFTLMDERVG